MTKSRSSFGPSRPDPFERESGGVTTLQYYPPHLTRSPTTVLRTHSLLTVTTLGRYPFNPDQGPHSTQGKYGVRSASRKENRDDKSVLRRQERIRDLVGSQPSIFGVGRVLNSEVPLISTSLGPPPQTKIVTTTDVGCGPSRWGRGGDECETERFVVGFKGITDPDRDNEGA